MFCGDEVGAIVGDLGSEIGKVGYASEDYPRDLQPTCVGVVGSDEYYFGDAARRRRDNMRIESMYSKTDGSICDWNLAEKLWEDIYCPKRLALDATERPLLVVEPTDTSRENREKHGELLFEKIGVPALYFAREALLSAFSCGRSNALVLQIGASGSVVAPIHQGFVLTRSVHRSSLGCLTLTRQTLRLLESKTGVEVLPQYEVQRRENSEQGWSIQKFSFPKTHASFRKQEQLDVARDVKESCFYCTAPNIPPATSSYYLPDGTFIEFDAKESSTIPELFFQPELLPQTEMERSSSIPLQHLLYNCVSGCDAEIRCELLRCIIIAGGGSCTKHLSKRLVSEMQQLLPSTHKVSVLAPGKLGRKNAPYIGGSILSSLGSFHQKWVSKQEYDEYGKSYFHIKVH
eukprot:g2703.t1